LIVGAVLAGVLVARSSTSGAGKDRMPSAPEYAASVPGSTTDEQADVLRDGVVSLEEYEASIQRTISCASAAGVQVEANPARGQRPTRMAFKAGSWSDAVAAKAAFDDCRSKFLDRVEIAWALEKSSFSEAESQSALAALEQCMQSRGGGGNVPGFENLDALGQFLIRPPEGDVSEWARLRRQYAPCKDLVEEQTGFRLP
jgi:hypothetical protein